MGSLVITAAEGTEAFKRTVLPWRSTSRDPGRMCVQLMFILCIVLLNAGRCRVRCTVSFCRHIYYRRAECWAVMCVCACERLITCRQ